MIEGLAEFLEWGSYQFDDEELSLAATAYTEAVSFLRSHPEFLKCGHNAALFVKEIAWIQHTPTAADFEAIHWKLKTEGKLLSKPGEAYAADA